MRTQPFGHCAAPMSGLPDASHVYLIHEQGQRHIVRKHRRQYAHCAACPYVDQPPLIPRPGPGHGMVCPVACDRDLQRARWPHHSGTTARAAVGPGCTVSSTYHFPAAISTGVRFEGRS